MNARVLLMPFLSAPRSRQGASILTVLSLAVFVLTVQPAQQRLHAAQEAQLARAEALKNVPASAPDPQAQFLAQFPPLARAPDSLRVLLKAAQDASIDLAQAEYRLERSSPGTELSRYEVTLPISAAYPQVRRFLALMLEGLPHAAINAVSFERNQAADTQVRVRIELTLFVRRTGAV